MARFLLVLFLLTSVAVSAQVAVEHEIEKLRARISDNPDDERGKRNLAIYLVKKALGQQSLSNDDVGTLFEEAAGLQPQDDYFQRAWGMEMFMRGDTETAIQHLESAYGMNSNEFMNCSVYGMALSQTMKYDSAATVLEQARSLNPKDFRVAVELGKCYTNLHENEKAMQVFEETEELAKTQDEINYVKQQSSQALEALSRVKGSTKDESKRFIIFYAGDSEKYLGDKVYNILENVFDLVTDDLNFRPEIKINVMFFNTDDFYQANQAKQWVGGLAAGEKILIPLKTGFGYQEQVRGTLAHEFTHVIMNIRTRNQCPTWINEGIAQYMEFKYNYGSPELVRSDYIEIFNKRIVRKKERVSISKISIRKEDSQTGDNIQFRYLMSYLAVRFLIERFGMKGFDELSSALAEGVSDKLAVERATKWNFEMFQKELYNWMDSVTLTGAKEIADR